MPPMKDRTYLLLVLALGIVATFLTLLLAFFPGMRATVGFLFGALGVLVVRLRPRIWWRSLVALLIPVMAFVILVVARFDPAALKRGVGIAWVHAAFIIPAATWLGGYAAHRIATPPPREGTET